MSIKNFTVKLYQCPKGVQVCRKSQMVLVMALTNGALAMRPPQWKIPPEVTQNALDCRCDVEKEKRALGFPCDNKRLATIECLSEDRRPILALGPLQLRPQQRSLLLSLLGKRYYLLQTRARGETLPRLRRMRRQGRSSRHANMKESRRQGEGKEIKRSPTS